MSKVAELVRRRAELVREQARINRELEQVDAQLANRFEKMVATFEGDQLSSEAPEAVQAIDLTPRAELLERIRAVSAARAASLLVGTPKVAEARGRKPTLVPHVARILAKRNGPMRTAAILDELRKLGVPVAGNSPLKNLSAHLSHHEAFVTTPDGWVLRNPSLLDDDEKNNASAFQ